MWFDSFSDLVRVVAVGTAAYATVVVVLRLTGKRTLSKLNAFDLVVTVALGSTLATILLNSSVSWAEGAVAILLLALLQTAVAWITARHEATRRFVTARPQLLLRNGQLLPDALRGERVSLSEIRQAVRAAGSGGLDGIGAVVLETDGSLSVIRRDKVGDGSAFEGVDGVASETGGSR